jgi:UDP-N-acetylmuramate dehydrogenase
LNLGGAEFLTGIPGTLGAAVLMNAGTKDRSIAEIVKTVKVIDYNGRVKIIGKKKINFQYRSSRLSRYIILSVQLKLVKSNKKKIAKKIKKYLVYRWATQDLTFPNAGCIFRNPGRLSAGRLIDVCGLKGKCFGGAQISLKHANFIANKNMATASDVIHLMDYIKRKVKQKFNNSLKPEIKIWQN